MKFYKIEKPTHCAHHFVLRYSFTFSYSVVLLHRLTLSQIYIYIYELRSMCYCLIPPSLVYKKLSWQRAFRSLCQGRGVINSVTDVFYNE